MRILISLLLLCSPLIAHAALLFTTEYNDSTFGGAQVCSGATCPSGFPSVPIAAAKQLVTNPARIGAGAVKMILLPTYMSCYVYGQGPFNTAATCDRSEFEKLGLTRVGDERWYGISVYVDPSYTDTSNDPNGTIISQWHDSPDPCDILKSPHLYIGITKAPYHWRVRNQWDANPCTTNIAINRTDLDLGAVTTGVWVDFVVHAKWSYTSTGLLEVYMNGTRVVNRPATPNIYNDQQAQNWKWGPYKSWWTQQAPSPTDQIVVYYDQIRMGDASSSLAEVSSPTTPTLTAPTSLAVIVGP